MDKVFVASFDCVKAGMCVVFDLTDVMQYNTMRENGIYFVNNHLPVSGVDFLYGVEVGYVTKGMNSAVRPSCTSQVHRKPEKN